MVFFVIDGLRAFIPADKQYMPSVLRNTYTQTDTDAQNRLPGDEGAVFFGGIDRIVSVGVVEEISRSRRAAGHSACRSERSCEPSYRDVRGRHG